MNLSSDRLALWALIVALAMPVSLKVGTALPTPLAEAVLQYWQVIAAALAGYIGRGALDRTGDQRQQQCSHEARPPVDSPEGEG